VRAAICLVMLLFGGKLEILTPSWTKPHHKSPLDEINESSSGFRLLKVSGSLAFGSLDENGGTEGDMLARRRCPAMVA